MKPLAPMGIGQILDTAFRLYRRRFATFVGIATVVAVPTAFVAALVDGAARAFLQLGQPDDDGLLNVVSAATSSGSWARSGFAAAGTMPVFDPQSLGGSALALVASVIGFALAALLVLSVAYPLCTGALVVTISASYLGEDVGAMASYGRAARKLWRLLTAQAWTTLLVLLGLCLCVVPGVVLALQLLLVPQVVLLEDQTAWAAIRRARALIADYLGKAFVLGGVVWLLGLVIGVAVSVAVHAVPWPLPLIADFLTYLVVEVAMLPLSVAAVVLFYYDLRIRKEAFDLQHLATSMVEFKAP